MLPVDKPYRWTSADVIRKIKYAAIRHFGKKNLKVGHAGTLDPLATGILLVCIGAATRRAEELQRSPKEYIAGVSFGAMTPSYDLEKDIDRECPLDGVSEAALRAVLPEFTGEQEQVAPLFSAKSVDGVRAYETARRLLKEAQRAGRAFDPGDALEGIALAAAGSAQETGHAVFRLQVHFQRKRAELLADVHRQAHAFTAFFCRLSSMLTVSRTTVLIARLIITQNMAPFSSLVRQS